MQRIECSSLVLIGESGAKVSDIADLLVGDLVDDDGLKYQDLTMTTPLSLSVRPGNRLAVFDTAKKQQLCSFVVEGITTQVEGEQFLTINGRNYIAFPKNP